MEFGKRDPRRSLPVRSAVALMAAIVVFSSAPALADSSREPDHACRLWGMVGAPTDSIVQNQLVFGFHSLAALAAYNPDGWGLSYFAPAISATGLARPQILRGGPPADHEYDPRFGQAVTEMLDLDASCAIAHVRAASSGHIDAPDPHPFLRDSMIFAHNGTVDRPILEILLTADDPKYLDTHPPDFTNPYIDSELYFLYVRKLRENGVATPTGRRFGTADAIAAAALEMYGENAIRTAANCLMTEGDTLFALRFDPTDGQNYKLRYRKIPAAWVVASEPLGGDTTGWSPVPPKSLGIFVPGDEEPQFVTIFPPAGSWISVSETKIDDDSLGQSAGNDDKDFDAGEQIELSLLLENEGQSPATMVRAKLTSADTLIALIDSFTTYPNIPAGGSALPVSPFVIAAEPVCGYTRVTTLTLEVITGSGPDLRTWISDVRIPIFSPLFAYTAAIITDGNDNMLQPGEEGNIELWLTNSGGEAATTLSADLTSLHPHIQILNAQSGTDTLAAGETTKLWPPFRVAVAPDCPIPDFAGLSASLSADWDLTGAVNFEIPIGGFADAFEGGPGEWTHGSGTPGFTDEWHLSTARNHTPGGMVAWHCGVDSSYYSPLLDAMLISPVLPIMENSELRFWHFMQAQLGGHFGEAYDGGVVEASINGGPWQLLFPEGGYDFVISQSVTPGPFPAHTPVFSGYYPWREEVISIAGYEGTIQFRFRFGSDESIGLEGWYIDDVSFIGRQTSSGVEEQPVALLPSLAVGGPNPFRESTIIMVNVVRPGPVDLAILDLEGRVLRHLEHGVRAAGRHRIVWDGLDGNGRSVPSGLYFYRLRSENDAFEDVQRVIRLR